MKRTISTVRTGINEQSYVFWPVVVVDEKAESRIIYRTRARAWGPDIFQVGAGGVDQVQAIESPDAIGNRFRVAHYFFDPRITNASRHYS